MASRFQRQALLRKVVYLGLILILFTVSLLHRRLIVIPQAYNLQLREEARGEVELTSSAVRLMTTGLRGWATCSLWLAAIEKQRKNEWSQLELLVRSITKLQPYFASPWLFQSWNLAFNVSVECDRVKDKYFYITRGIELLAEGERRNRGGDFLTEESRRLRFPGNPEMRFCLGFWYQLKIGEGDEQDALRCLYDMSCIDPAERDPESLRAAGEQGQEVDRVKFEQFCKKYPRLVRRLRESKMEYESPREVVRFLEFNKDVPSRYEKPQLAPGAEHQPTRLKPLTERFPILPPPSDAVLAQHGTKDRDKIDDLPAGEDFDVFCTCRKWYEYAQEPLPPPNPDPGVDDQEFARLHYRPQLQRLPKMAQQIYRGYPSRAQAFYAEYLQRDGWFDAEGWRVKGWFDRLHGGAEVRIGTEAKYHSGLAWGLAHTMYKQYGRENGLYLTPGEEWEYMQRARPFLDKHKMEAGQAVEELSSADQKAGLEDSLKAAKKIKWNRFYRTMTNYDAYFYQTEAEQLPEAVAARKGFFQAERLRRFGAAPEQALAVYEATLPRWVDVLLTHRDFSRISTVQEDTYETQMRYLRLLQDQRDGVLKPLVTGVAQLGMRLPVPLEAAPTYFDERTKIIPIRQIRGPLEMIYLYDHPQIGEVRQTLFDLARGAMQPPPLLTPQLAKYLKDHTLVLVKAREPEGWKSESWRPLIDDEIIRQVRIRLGISRPEQAPESNVPTPPTRRRLKK